MNETIIIPLGTVAPYPKEDKNCSSYLIKHKDNNILLDCGNGSTRLLNMESDLNNLKIFISHLHPDHYGDLISLLQTIMVYKKYGYIKNDIELYIPQTIVTEEESYKDKDGWACLRALRTNIIDYKYIKKYAEIVGVDLKELKGKINLKYDDIIIDSILVPHQLESYAIKVITENGTIVYSGDTGTNNNLEKFAKNSDLLICESTFLKGQYRSKDGHLYAHEAAMIAKCANVKKLLLTHFWPEIDKQKYVDEAKVIFENTDYAVEGKKLILRR